MLRLSSDQLLLPPEVDRAAEMILRPLGGQPSLVFLAIALEPAGPPPGDVVRKAAEVPYSTVLGMESPVTPAGALVDGVGHTLPLPAVDEIILDRWTVDDLAAQGRPVEIGDPILVRHFRPETLHGRVEETTTTLRLAGVADMRGVAVARDVVPEVAGITDERSIADWDPPFPFDRSRVRTTPPRDEDDRYWKLHGVAPKAFVALETARSIAGSRFGSSTAWFLPWPAEPAAEALPQLRRMLAAALEPERVGLHVRPLAAEALAAARGSTPFGSLFLALSSFLVAAGLVLCWLLFGLMVAARRRDLGVLSATGWPPRRIAALLLLVGGWAALAGVVIGTLLGPPWAAILLAGLARWWSADVATGTESVFTVASPRLVEALPGGMAALGLALMALALAAVRAGRLPPLGMMGGGDATSHTSGGNTVRTALAAVTLLAAAALAWAGGGAAWQEATARFFLAGVLSLIGLLALVRGALDVGGGSGPVRSLIGLASRSLAHRPGRGFSVAAIVGLAQFLVVAVSSFAMRPPADPSDRHSPTGGWSLVASFASPTSVDPSDAESVTGLGLSEAEAEALLGCEVALVRSSAGDDASCANLYAARGPTVLGVGSPLVRRGGFRFAATVSDSGGGLQAWAQLERPTDPGAPLPAILDQATATWALGLRGIGSVFTVPDDAGQAVPLEVVGLLDGSFLQGAVLVSEVSFQRLFPTRSGYGAALIDLGGVPPARRTEARTALATAWADSGVSLEPTLDRLRRLQGVQNTFLAGFQALGAIGLVLGSAGVAAVQSQGMLERRGQFALLRALGFSVGRLRLVIVLETVLTVGLGLLAGTLAGSVAVAPLVFGLGGHGVAGRVPLAWIAATWALTLGTAVAAGMLAASRWSIPERPEGE